MKTPEQFTPADADFCIITFTLLPSPFLSRTSLEQRNAAVWNVTGGDALNGQIGQLGATTFVAPRLDRSRSWYQSRGDRPLDVTGNIYIGARPGHNQQAEDSPHTRHTSHSVPGRYRPFCMPGPKTFTYLQLSTIPLRWHRTRWSLSTNWASSTSTARPISSTRARPRTRPTSSRRSESSFLCAWPRLSLWQLSVPQPTICVRRSSTRVREAARC